MATKRFSKKLLKITAYFLGGFVVLLIAFHFWFINHVEQLIEDLVDSRSNGKLKLEIKKFKFNWFSNRMELRNAVFYSTDTINASTAYRFNIKTARLQVRKIWPLIFEKTVLFDSLRIIDPDIVVTRLHAKDTSAVEDTSLSIPQEMGKIYNSIQDALKVLQVSRFQIENGKFTLVDKTKPDDRPIAITNLSLRLDNLQIDTSNLAAKNKILFSDNVELNTHHQNILFPDDRHRLSFSNFHVNIQNRMAEFDSCTITATKGDSAKASFSIFFDKLLMTNIDFDTLYHKEIIKADSVFCINPRFRLNVDLVKRDPAKSPPRLDEMVQQLTGDMQLAFVSVQNGSFDINTTREGRPSSFTSDNNNFQLEGLKIRKNAPRPLIVEKFVMAIHNYENFLRDSAYAMQFDSILINNNRISLGNFAYQELENNKPVNNLTMSQFELQGLSWDNLVFDRQLKAENVILYRPIINYNFTRNNEKSKNIFETLGSIGNILQLDNLDVVDGQVNLYFKNNIRLQLENADIFVLGRQLVNAKKHANIRKSITGFNFKKGIFTMGDVTANLSNIRFNGTNNHLEAGNIIIKKKDDITIDAANVILESMILDDDLQQVNIDGIKWGKAAVSLSSLKKSKVASSNFVLKNVNGSNTVFTVNDSSTKFSLTLRAVLANEISTANGKWQLDGLDAEGSDMKMSQTTSYLSINSFNIKDHQSSSLTNIIYSNNSRHDSAFVSISSLTFIPDINAIVDNKFYADAVTINKPIIRLIVSSSGESNPDKKQAMPELNIGKIMIRQPQFYFVNATDKGVASLEWKIKDDNYVELDNVKMNSAANGLSIDKVQFSISNFLYNISKGRSFDAGNGKITAVLGNLKMQKNEINAWDWQAIVQNLHATNFIIDSIDKKSGRLTINTAQLNDLSISSSTLLNLRELIKSNTAFNLENVTGNYINEKDQLHWHNAGYNKKTKYFSTDSIFYRPTKEKDAYIAFQPYQSDYTTIQTGKIIIGPFDIYRYIKDTVLDLGIIKVSDAYMTGFRDKRKLIQPGLIKPLPVNTLKKFSTHLLIDTISLSNTRVEYNELNDKTNATGKIIVSRLNGNISHIRNYDMTSSDSLHIQATGLIQDSILTKLNVKESYTDPMGGFTMTVRMSPADIRVLNPVLIPLASVELKSGSIDTLMMQVNGNDDFAYGQLKMVYHDLKVKVYKTKNGKQRPAAGILNFFANFIVKNKNKDRVSSVIFTRWKDRSPINYIVKITMSGISSSVGFKKNKKELRRYKKEIKEIRLLPSVFD